MKNQTNNTIGKSRLMDVGELQVYTSLGRNNAMKLGNEIGARVQIGRRILYDRVKVDQYFNSLTGVN